MCDFLSFTINASVLDGEPLIVWIGNGTAHDGIEEGWGLVPGQYREAEWVGDGRRSLRVRGEAGENDAALRAAVIAAFPTRTALFRRLRWGRIGTNGFARFTYRSGHLYSAECCLGRTREMGRAYRDGDWHGWAHYHDGPGNTWRHFCNRAGDLTDYISKPPAGWYRKFRKLLARGKREAQPLTA